MKLPNSYSDSRETLPPTAPLACAPARSANAVLSSRAAPSALGLLSFVLVLGQSGAALAQEGQAAAQPEVAPKSAAAPETSAAPADTSSTTSGAEKGTTQADADAPSESDSSTSSDAGESEADPSPKTSEEVSSSAPEAVSAEATAAAVPAADENEEVAKEAEAASADSEQEPSSKESTKAEGKAAEPAPPALRPNQLPFTYHQKHWDLSVALRIKHFRDESAQRWIDSTTRVGPDLRLGQSYGLSRHLHFAWDLNYGYLAGSSRFSGEYSELRVHDMHFGLRLGLDLTHRFALTARVAPGASLAQARFGSGDDALQGNKWLFSSQQTLGTRIRLAGPNNGEVQGARLWLFVEGGFDLSSKGELTLKVKDSDIPGAQPVSAGSLQLMGPVGLLGLNLGY